jgi:hypothetical protein
MAQSNFPTFNVAINISQWNFGFFHCIFHQLRTLYPMVDMTTWQDNWPNALGRGKSRKDFLPFTDAKMLLVNPVSEHYAKFYDLLVTGTSV